MAREKNRKETVEALGDALKRLRDEVELKIHLATMDTRDAWESLKPDIDALQKKFGEAIHSETTTRPAKILFDEARLQMHLAVMNARDAWDAIEPKILPIVDHLEQAAREVGKAARTTEEQGRVRDRQRAKHRVQHQTRRAKARAKLEKEAAKRRARVRADLRRAQEALDAAAKDAVGQIKLGIEAFRDAVAKSTKRAA